MRCGRWIHGHFSKNSPVEGVEEMRLRLVCVRVYMNVGLKRARNERKSMRFIGTFFFFFEKKIYWYLKLAKKLV